ncbi:hypothetical protein QBC36DRAFT_344938 [Triangularia setosa]|uniref:Uncharacterized protein n=1 Tax=Triangularia setosa TaxID=2587417 RepID=A0AAN6WDD9_9PEZI|nr:hypothetical protein QBC36DRAFT_344938 [Podospora setosa]
MGLTNVRSASNAWGSLKKKILAIDAKDKAANPGKAAAEESSITSKTPVKGKRAATAMSEGDADAADTPTPTKKPRSRKPKVAAAPKTEEDVKAEGAEDATINFVTPTPKKPLRGRAAAAKAKAETATIAAAEAVAAAAVAKEVEDNSESDIKDEASGEEAAVTVAKFAPVKSDEEDDDVEELVNPDDIAQLEKIAAAGVKTIKEEEADDGII